MFALILIGFALAVGIPAFVAWLIIKYVFELRKRQNDEMVAAIVKAIKENKND